MKRRRCGTRADLLLGFFAGSLVGSDWWSAIRPVRLNVQARESADGLSPVHSVPLSILPRWFSTPLKASSFLSPTQISLFSAKVIPSLPLTVLVRL